MTRILMRLEHGHLVPVDATSEEELQPLNVGEVVTVTIRKTRNPQLQRLYWSILTKVFNNQERHATKEKLHSALKVYAGFYSTFPLSNGTEAIVPDSTSFDDMDELKFREYVHKVCDAIAKHFLPNLGDTPEAREIATMIGARIG